MLNNIKSAYFIGIKGVGMTALAQIFKEKYKIRVSGSDTDEEFFTDKVLKARKIKFYNGFSEKNLPQKIDLVVVSSAYNQENNIEVKEAKNREFKIIEYSDGLAMLFKNNFGIAVCGSHGKTTTTAMLGYVLKRANLKPTVVVGSNVPQFKGNGLVGKSKYLVVEADEYQAKFLHYDARAIILTNVDYDHPDFFKNEKSYKEVFWKFVKKLPQNGILIANIDDKNVKDLVKKIYRNKLPIKVLEYSTNLLSLRATERSEAIPSITDVACIPRDCFVAPLRFAPRNDVLYRLNLKIPGAHNISNALAVLTLAQELGIAKKNIIKYLNEFKGTTRRFEYKGKYRGAIIIDDYAHHPAEVQATLKAAREKYPDKKIWCVFHPHTFSRTEALFDDFVKSFTDADKIIILDIYNSAREIKGNVHSKDLVKAINENHFDALYLSTKEDAAEYLKNNLEKNDILITMGAGDVWKIGEELLKN